MFGKVLEGMKVVKQIEQQARDRHDKPMKDVKIAKCGSLAVTQKFAVDMNDATED